MKIFPTQSIKELDAYTIENEPIASIDLMERASQALTKAIMKRWEAETPITVFAGPGNNGGDALAVSFPTRRSSDLIGSLPIAGGKGLPGIGLSV